MCRSRVGRPPGKRQYTTGYNGEDERNPSKTAESTSCEPAVVLKVISGADSSWIGMMVARWRMAKFCKRRKDERPR